MKQLDIGGSGVLGSAIGVGCMRMNCMEPQAILEYIHTALEKGINFFDHADIYGGGECETRFGQALALEPGLREKLVLQTKCGIRPDRYDFSKEHILESVEGSLRRLGTDHVDFLLLHRPDALMEPEEVAEAFQQLESQGKVLHFGVSNFSARQLELLQSGLKQKLRANQMQFGIMCAGMVSHSLEANTHFPNAADRDGEVLDYCRLKGITIQAWSPFQYGFFEGVFIDNEKFPALNEKLQQLSEKYGVSKSALAVAWILRHPAGIQAIVGTTKAQRLADIATAADIQLSREDWYQIYLAGGEAPGEHPKKALLRHGFAHPFGQGPAKAGERHRGPAARELRQGAVQPQGAQDHPRRDKQHHDPGGGQLGQVDEQLAYYANQPAHPKRVEIFHGFHPFSRPWPAGL